MKASDQGRGGKLAANEQAVGPAIFPESSKQPVEIGRALKNLDQAGYSRLLMEMSLLEATYNSYSRGGANRLGAVAKRYRINVQKITESVAADLAARRKKRDGAPESSWSKQGRSHTGGFA